MSGMKEQAEKLLEKMKSSFDADRTAMIAHALEAAREEGRKEARAKQYHCHTAAICPDCAKLKEQGAEELREKVLEEARKNFSAAVYEAIKALPCLAPPKPKVPEWFKEFHDALPNGRTLEKHYAAYLTHAPIPDAGELAEAIYIQRVDTSGPRVHVVAALTAAIRAAMEGR